MRACQGPRPVVGGTPGVESAGNHVGIAEFAPVVPHTLGTLRIWTAGVGQRVQPYLRLGIGSIRVPIRFRQFFAEVVRRLETPRCLSGQNPQHQNEISSWKLNEAAIGGEHTG